MNKYEGFTEKELIVLLQQDNEGALRPLYENHVKALHYFILRISKSKALAEDVVQDVFVKLWENRAQIDPDQPFKTYLYTIAKRHLLNLLKRVQHETQILDEIRKYTPAVEATTDLQLDYAESNHLVQEAIEKLPPQCKAVFIRCKVQGMTYKNVALELGIAEGTVHAQMVKALRIIKEYINLKNAVLLLLVYLKNY
ncbi:RNA polymerase sigma-70 factor [Sphingobacterium psychroaquaticum]|uniref:RNA polymerase sigma factor n=1 Tax=Sphingobacterium psychroaquaticum TaxID=561061 RepID=UPI00106B4DD4|nr:RNA polymerase sigma-70 factor [Sphingobacterium psychroaquaticum]QBQ41581.1 RNA polymerase sigma-70 factor [Sphingobacterium psychroaquaticum]